MTEPRFHQSSEKLVLGEPENQRTYFIFDVIGRPTSPNTACVDEWCTEHFGAWELHNGTNPGWRWDTTRAGNRFFFLSEQDATAFKLRWC